MHQINKLFFMLALVSMVLGAPHTNSTNNPCRRDSALHRLVWVAGLLSMEAESIEIIHIFKHRVLETNVLKRDSDDRSKMAAFMVSLHSILLQMDCLLD